MPFSLSGRLGAIFGVFGISGLISLPGVAAAGPLPTDFLTILFTPDTSYTPTFFRNTPSASMNGASAAIQVSPGPVVLANSSSKEDASAGFDYYLRISGPSGVSAVPLDITYLEEVVGIAGFGFSAASLHISQIGFVSPHFISSINSDSGVLNGNTRDYSVSATYSSLTAGDHNYGVGTNIVIDMFTYARGGGGSAFIDPIVSIDPSFFPGSGYTASDFTITASPGVGNSLAGLSAVPEPSTDFLLLTAGGALARLRGRRKAPLRA
jgi:hypothetical protein